MTSVNAAWDGVIADLQRDIGTRKANVIAARVDIDEVRAAYERRIAEMTAVVDREIDQIAALQSLLDHAVRQRDGDPLVEAVEAPAWDPEHPEVRRPTADDYRQGE